MASGGLDAELARLSGSQLVARLRSTHCGADYEAAARVLEARDRRLAQAEASHAEVKEGLVAALAEVAALREKYDALEKGARRGPGSQDARPRDDVIAAPAPPPAPRGERRAKGVAVGNGWTVIDLTSSDEEEEGRRAGFFRKRKAAASEVHEEGPPAGVSRKRNAAASSSASDDEDDTLTLSQLQKKRAGAVPGAHGKPMNADEGAHANSVRPLGDSLKEISLVIKEKDIEATVGGSEDPELDAFVQGMGNGKSGEDGGKSGAMPIPNPLKSAVGDSSQKNSSMANSAGPLGSDLHGTPTVIRERPEAKVDGSEVAAFLLGRRNGKSAEDGAVSMAMLSDMEMLIPPGFAPRTSSHKKFSKVDHGGAGTVANGNDLLETLEIRERPEARVGGSEEPKTAAFEQGRGDCRSAEDGGVSRTMLSSMPHGFAASTGSQKNFSKLDHAGARITKECSFAGPEEDVRPLARSPSVSARKIVESTRGGVEPPKVNIGSTLGETGSMVLGLNAIREQEKTNGRVHKTEVLPGTNATREQGRAGMVVRAIGEQDKISGLVHKTNELLVTKEIWEQGGKLSSSQSREVNGGTQLSTSDKQLGSAALPPNSGLHSGQTSEEGLLPSAVTRHWKDEIDVFTTCLENKEICLQAACALYRRRKLLFQPTEGGRSGSAGLCKSDARRASELVEFLLDGNLQGPLKRTAEELMKYDSTGVNLLEKVVCQFHEQLFGIYKNKEDPYFH